LVIISRADATGDTSLKTCVEPDQRMSFNYNVFVVSLHLLLQVVALLMGNVAVPASLKEKNTVDTGKASCFCRRLSMTLAVIPNYGVLTWISRSVLYTIFIVQVALC
jgi:hypothetical protein